MPAKKIMVQSTGFGTGSGKSFLVALLCRLFKKQGMNVAPFKTLNLTSVTYKKEGREFGYSQALQAVSAKLEPEWRMNPYTIKPRGDGQFDSIIHGKKQDEDYNPSREFLESFVKKILKGKSRVEEVKEKILEVLYELEKEYELIVIEGTGGTKIFGLSLFSSLLDMGNMGIAKAASLPTIFITDNLDSIPHTFSYLSEEEKKLVKGAIVNNVPTNEFLKVGIKEKWLDISLKRIRDAYTNKIGLAVLGSLPHFDEVEEIPELDPISPGEKIPLDVWEEKIEIISQKAKKHLDLKRIYSIAKE